MRENARTRGVRLLGDGRLVVSHVSGKTITAVCRGDSGEIHRLGLDPQRGWWCACPAMTKCGHLVALQLVTLAPVAVETEVRVG